ncbi:Stromal cell-derived factor 2 [Balamuthia mandrillaris]
MRFLRSPCVCAVLLGLIVLSLSSPAQSWWGAEEGQHQHEHHHDEHDHSHDEGEPDPDITTVVTCGSVIALKHVATGYRLHSHQVAYGSGSGQQSVTAVTSADDTDNLWTVRGPHGGHCRQGTPVKKGQTIRLQHLSTRQNLHSHLHVSPLSRQQEVSCFGENGKGDSGDNWDVECNGDIWQRGEQIMLRHSDTGLYLHSHPIRYRNPIPGQQEVTANVPSEQTKWTTEEGIYFPVLEENTTA